LAAGLGDLSAEFDLGNIDAELPEIDRLDLSSPEQAAPALESFDSVAPEPIAAETVVNETVVSETVAADVVFEAADAFAGADENADAGDEFDFLADADEIATKLDLARAYIDMGDTDGAKDILDEVMQEGTDTQKQEASTLLNRIG
jgi:pilus assembly protein FimV